MRRYKPAYNFLIPVLRIGFLAFLAWVLIKWASILIDKDYVISSNWTALLYIAFVLGIFTMGGYQMIKGLLTETLLVEFTPDGITVINLILFKKYFIRKQDIRRIYPSYKQFAKGTCKTININTAQGKKLELMQFNYFCFKKIMPAISKMSYKVNGYRAKNTETIIK